MALFPDATQVIDASVAMLSRLESEADDAEGGHERLDTGVVGDAVNTAARIESLTKTYGRPLLLSEQTKQAANEGAGRRFEEVDTVRPKGKRDQITLYAVQ